MTKPLTGGTLIANIVLVLFVFSANRVHAWGNTAHKIICEIAFKELNPQARAEVERLIGLDPEFSTFSDSCTWPSYPRRRSKEHYVNLRRSMVRLTNDPCPTADKCVVTAIESDFKILTDAAVSDAGKLRALKFLGHWVGDVHQPLHVSFGDDRGGNLIWGTGPCVRELHGVWDDCILETKLGTDVGSIATKLRRAVTPADRSQWNNLDVKTWANESFNIATSEAVEYCIKKKGACWYAPDRLKLDRAGEIKVVVVDNAYMEQHLPVIRKRLMQAGIRLGYMLNLALGGQSLSGPAPVRLEE